MEEDLDTYLALSSPEASGWPQDDKQLAGVLKTSRVRQPFPLLLAAKRALSAADFTGLLRAATVISLRCKVIGAYSTGEQERTCNAVAERIAKKDLVSLVPASQAMRGVYPNDKAFHMAFANKVMRTMDSRNNRVTRFIPCALEKHLSNQGYGFTSGAFNVEHALSRNAPDDRDGFSNDEALALSYRLGDMTLLETAAKRDLGMKDHTDKREVYKQSGFAITRKLAEESAEWTPERIAARQMWMASQATAIWRIARLGG
jgi:hypothetical protein